MQVKDILTRQSTSVVMVSGEQTLRDVVELLVQHRVEALLVVNNTGDPIGMISERDVICAASQNEKFYDQRVAAIMTPCLGTSSPHDDIRTAKKTMSENPFPHLPIMDQGKLVGIISRGDIIQAEVEEYEGEIDRLLYAWREYLPLSQPHENKWRGLTNVRESRSANT